MTRAFEGYRWPAEWELHDGTLLAWPINEQTWPGTFDRIPQAFAGFVAQLTRFEPVWILASGPQVVSAAQPLIEQACEKSGSRFGVRFLDIPVNDSWCRDYGPMLLSRQDSDGSPLSVGVIDWEWNAWGGKYPPWDLDSQVSSRVAEYFGLPVRRPAVVLEGGAVDGNGRGTVLCTASCLLNPNRNGTVDRAWVEQLLAEYLGTRGVVWLPGDGILGDDTDGHIDQLARFVDERRVLLAAPFDEDTPEAAALRANAEAIARSRNADGQSLQPVFLKLPQPAWEQNHRLPMSYCNFCLVNDGVVVPTFRDPADEEALQIIRDCFPGRTVVGQDARDLVWGLGAFHCLSQQLPAGTVTSTSNETQPGR